MKIRIAFNKLRFTSKPDNMNWETFNTSFKNVELDMLEICNAIYRGHAYTAWMDGKRKKENFICAQHIGIDMDCCDYRSSLDALSEHPLVREYGAIIHTTPSHRSHAPKARVIFLLDGPIDNVQGYEMAQETLYSLFDGADMACVDGARFFYGNGRLSVEKNTDEIWFDKEPCLPLKDLRMFTRQYIKNKQNQERQMAISQPPARAENGKEPSLHEIGQKLMGVDSYALSYNWWLKVIAGLKHEFGDAAWDLARQWSDKPGKPGLNERTWRALGAHDTPATIATVYKVLHEQGVT